MLNKGNQILGKAIQFQRQRESHFSVQRETERAPLSLLKHSRDEIDEKREN